MGRKHEILAAKAAPEPSLLYHIELRLGRRVTNLILAALTSRKRKKRCAALTVLSDHTLSDIGLERSTIELWSIE